MCESKVARESPPVFTRIYQHPPGNNRESSRGRQAAREKNRVLGGGRDPPQNPIFFCFFKGFGCSERASRCRLRGFFFGFFGCLGFLACFFRVGFLPWFFQKPKTKTPNPKPAPPQPDPAQPVGPAAEKSWLGGSFWTAAGGHVPAQKNELFLAGISQRFSLFFFRNRREISEKNKQKT